MKNFSDGLISAGVPILNVNTAYATLHPLMAVVSMPWDREAGSTGVQFHPHREDLFRTGPLAPFDALLASDRQEMQLDLKSPATIINNPSLKSLADAGATDFIGFKVHLSNVDKTKLRTDDMLLFWTTDVSGGFTEDHLEAIRMVQNAMVVVFKLANRERLTLHILSAYLGEKSGQQVLEGNIKLGDGQTIPAVIWFSDLRGSTPLSERLPPQVFLDMLNDYFDALAGSIVLHGGEVLRFIGDAALAIFPIGDNAFALEEAKTQALAAARHASSRAVQINDQRKAQGLEPFEYGIGLHVGDIMFGNIGIPSRIEFSVIGPAANQAARVEALCKELEEPILVSDTFADGTKVEWRSRGLHKLRGVERKFEILAPQQAKKYGVPKN